jgi:hypothetical protein
MATNNHTDIGVGAAANAATINGPLGELDAAIGNKSTLTTDQKSTLVGAVNEVDLHANQVTSEVTVARGPYANLDNRLDSIVASGGNIATLANSGGAEPAGPEGQPTVLVDSTTGFVVGARVAYYLNGTTLEYNTIDTVDGPDQITFANDIGTGGIINATVVAMISQSEYEAAQAVYHSSSFGLTLDQAVKYAGKNIYHIGGFGGFPGLSAAINDAAIQDALTTIAANGGGVLFFSGLYDVSDEILIDNAGTFIDSEIGRGKSIIRANQTSGNVIRLESGTYFHNTGIKNLEIRATTTYDNNTLVGINLVNAVACQLENIFIQNCQTGLLNDIWLTTLKKVDTTLCGTGQKYLDGSNCVTIIGGNISSNVTGIDFEGGSQIKTMSIDVESNTTGIVVGPGTTSLAVHGYIENNDTEIEIDGNATGTMVNGVKISGYLNHTTKANIPITLAYCKHVDLSDLDVRNIDTAGDLLSIGTRVDSLNLGRVSDVNYPYLAPNFLVPVEGPMSRDNQLRNGSFDLWSLGDNVAPDRWYLYNATIARTTGDQRDGLNVVDLTLSGSGGTLRQEIPIPAAYRKAGVFAIMVADIKHVTGADGSLALSPRDNAGALQGLEGLTDSISSTSWGTYATWPAVIGASATKLVAYLYPGGQTCFARVAVYFGCTPWPFERHPLDYRVLWRDATNRVHNTADSGDLGTYTLPGKTMMDGEGIRIMAAGSISGTNNTKTIKVNIGTTTLAQIDLAAGETDDWLIDLEIYRNGTLGLKCIRRVQQGSAFEQDIYNYAGADTTLESDNVIAVNATLASASDSITERIFVVERK